MKSTVLAVSLVLFCATRIHAQAPFYEGKTAKIIAGFGAGSVDDVWSRMLARYMGKHIAGTPNFIVQNMPGAGAMIAANYAYGVAKPGSHPCRHSRGALLRSTGAAQASAIRLAQVHLARQSVAAPSDDLHPRQFAL